MNHTLEALLEAARRWAEYASELPVKSAEDEELLEAIENYDGEEAS